ncbi:uncharacterized protein LOC105664665 [Ceratitis capitata]|uniref:uncharacterized protein LOC105664665 n=1 Tax=Ceratitis capitata TaxID=7213 RepID=UPI0006188C26|nr:uncharacterized protein LOC105664665 [Ceratitis capitata]
MSYIALVNTCNTASALAEQTVKKPNYTPGKALKKAYQLLKRVFKPSSTSSATAAAATGKVINSGEEQSNVLALEAAPLRHEIVEAVATTTTLNVSTLTTCSTLSAEEYENELNELAELEAASKLQIAV